MTWAATDISDHAIARELEQRREQGPVEGFAGQLPRHLCRIGHRNGVVGSPRHSQGTGTHRYPLLPTATARGLRGSSPLASDLSSRAKS